MKKTLLTLIVLIAALAATLVAQAQDMGPVVRTAYYLATDANGVQQVYQIFVGDTASEPRQITNAESNVLTFGASHDGLSITYVAENQLWLQPIHHAGEVIEAEALTAIEAEQVGAPVYSPNGDYIAYDDNGVWLYDLANREARQIVVNVPLAADGSNMAELRTYRPKQFAFGPETTYLVVDVGVWEWNSEGLYNVITDEFQFLEGQKHTNILPLYGDRVLIYGNSGVAGDFAFQLADSITDINNYNPVIQFAEETDNTLFADQAVELHPGVVRLFGLAIAGNPDEPTAFYFDYDLMGKKSNGVYAIKLGEAGEYDTLTGPLSRDGAIAVIYKGTSYSENNVVFGTVSLLDVVSGETLEVNLPETVGGFTWQP